jgi:hypothetical protein
MERIMGRADNPVRRLLDSASQHYLAKFPIVYVLTVVAADESGALDLRGLFIGDERECFRRAAELSLQVNFTMVDRPIKKAVVFLDPGKFKSTWLGNKAIYRTRMALADGAELIVLAPGVKQAFKLGSRISNGGSSGSAASNRRHLWSDTAHDHAGLCKFARRSSPVAIDRIARASPGSAKEVQRFRAQLVLWQHNDQRRLYGR